VAMLAELWLPIVLSGVALFFASFLSWMVVRLHKDDWRKLENEDAFLKAGREIGLRPGSYMFPCACGSAEVQSEGFQRKWKEGPCGVLTVYEGVNMGRNLALTFLYFLAISFALAYLATIGLSRGAAFLDVFRFFATAGFFVFVSAMVQHSIWFRNRIAGHVIESVAYAAIVGGLFGAFWPSA
jgi:hypothetical protein